MSITTRLAHWLASAKFMQLAISAIVDDSPGWVKDDGRSLHDLDPADAYQSYKDVLTAWRKNPIARRIVAITTDYIVGDSLSITSTDANMQKFIAAFWDHRKNKMDGRLQSMAEELSRAGDLFPVLFRNPHDGMSYIRFLTKDQIQTIETAAAGWETETVINQNPEGTQTKGEKWYTHDNGRFQKHLSPSLAFPPTPAATTVAWKSVAIGLDWGDGRNGRFFREALREQSYSQWTDDKNRRTLFCWFRTCGYTIGRKRAAI